MKHILRRAGVLSVLSVRERALRWAAVTPASPRSGSLCQGCSSAEDGFCAMAGAGRAGAIADRAAGGLLRERCFPGSPEPTSAWEPAGSSEPGPHRTAVTSSDFQGLFPLPGKARGASLRLSHAASLAGGSGRVTGNFKTQLQMRVSLLQSTFMHRGHCCLSAIML